VRIGKYQPMPPEAYAGQTYHRFVVPIEFTRESE
jgi:hypothetical protein